MTKSGADVPLSLFHHHVISHLLLGLANGLIIRDVSHENV